MSNFAPQQMRTQNSHLVRAAKPDRAATQHPMLAQQTALGNQAMQRMLHTGVIQAKLTVNDPGDQYEQEADRVAEQVMRMPDPGITDRAAARRQTASVHIQRMCPECEEKLHRQTQVPNIQRMCPACKEEEETLHAKEVAGQTPAVTPAVQAQVNALRGGGQPLPQPVRAFFEPRFGHDFSQVRIHTDVQAAESARSVNALAYTVGRNVVFRAGQYAPETKAGKRLLAHELTHVVQQTARPSSMPSLQRDFWDDEEEEEEEGGVLDWVSEQVGEATDWASETGGEVVDWATETGGEAVDWASETGGEVIDWATETGEEVVQWASETGGEVAEAAGSIWEEVTETAGPAWETAKEMGGAALGDQAASAYGLPWPSRRRPAVHLVTENIVTPEWLRAQGYRLVGSGRFWPQHWVHPETGDEVYVLRQVKGTEEPLPEEAPPEQGEETEPVEDDPVVADARNEADLSIAWRNQLFTDKAACAMKIGTLEYQSCYCQLSDSWNHWSARLDKVKKEFPEWDLDVSEEKRAELEVQKDRILWMLEDRSDNFVELFTDLPSPPGGCSISQ